MADFKSILSTRSNEIEKPKPIPIGTYLAMISERPEIKPEVGQNKIPVVEFKLKLMSATEDVDPDMLASYGSISGKELRHSFWLTNREGEPTVWRLKDFLENTLQIEPGDREIGDYMLEAVNRTLLVTVGHRPSPDGEMIYAEIKSVARAE